MQCAFGVWVWVFLLRVVVCFFCICYVVGSVCAVSVFLVDVLSCFCMLCVCCLGLIGLFLCCFSLR